MKRTIWTIVFVLFAVDAFSTDYIISNALGNEINPFLPKNNKGMLYLLSFFGAIIISHWGVEILTRFKSSPFLLDRWGGVVFPEKNRRSTKNIILITELQIITITMVVKLLASVNNILIILLGIELPKPLYLIIDDPSSIQQYLSFTLMYGILFGVPIIFFLLPKIFAAHQNFSTKVKGRLKKTKRKRKGIVALIIGLIMSLVG